MKGRLEITVEAGSRDDRLLRRRFMHGETCLLQVGPVTVDCTIETLTLEPGSNWAIYEIVFHDPERIA